MVTMTQVFMAFRTNLFTVIAKVPYQVTPPPFIFTCQHTTLHSLHSIHIAFSLLIPAYVVPSESPSLFSWLTPCHPSILSQMSPPLGSLPPNAQYGLEFFVLSCTEPFSFAEFKVLAFLVTAQIV